MQRSDRSYHPEEKAKGHTLGQGIRICFLSVELQQHLGPATLFQQQGFALQLLGRETLSAGKYRAIQKQREEAEGWMEYIFKKAYVYSFYI